MSNLYYKDLKLAQHPAGHKLIQTYTPLHVTNLFLLLLKDTFGSIPPEVDYPFKFDPDYNKTQILIDTVYNRESNIHGKPYLVVGRGSINTQPIVLGDRVVDNFTGKVPPLDDNLRIFNKYQTTQLQSNITIKVISKHSAEVDILSNEIFSFLTTTRTALTKHTPIQMSTNITVSEIGKFEQDDTMFYCAATMAYTLQYKWASFLRRNLLRSITVYLSTETVESQPPHKVELHTRELFHGEDLPETVD